LKDVFGAGWFAKVVLAVWLTSSVFVLFLLKKIDEIVHGQLYHFGLQFSLDWAAGYWMYMGMIYVFLAVPVVLSLVVLGFGFLRKTRGGSEVVKHEAKPVSEKTQPSKENYMLISCPNCKKVFSKPLVMLDFSGTKTRLVNVCPYCNTKLGQPNKEESPVSTGLLDLNQKEISK
jgi:uncharacterized Zn-finger protein